MKHTLLGLILLTSVLAVFTIASQSDEENLQKVEMSKILERRIQLVGLLGRPLGEVQKIRGHWKDRDFVKGSSKEFVVESVDGIELKSPVAFESFFVQATDMDGHELQMKTHDTWDMIAYEGIRVSNQEGLNKALGKPLNQNPFEGVRSFISGVVISVSRTK
jgi:hypothetical protein